MQALSNSYLEILILYLQLKAGY